MGCQDNHEKKSKILLFFLWNNFYFQFIFMKIFQPFFYIWLLTLGIISYYFFQLWNLENLFDFYIEITEKYKIYHSDTEEFSKYFHFYIILFFSVFFTFWWWIMSWKIKMIYMPLIIALIFWTLACYIPTVRFWFSIASISWILMFFIFFISLPSNNKELWILWKIKQRKITKLKNYGIQSQWIFVEILYDYSLKINNQPGQKAVFQTIHPLTQEKFLAESEVSFDPYFSLNIPKNIYVYFDKYDEKKYFCEIEKK